MSARAATAMVVTSDAGLRANAIKAFEMSGIPLVAQIAKDARLFDLLGSYPADILLLDASTLDHDTVQQLSQLHQASPRTILVLALDFSLANLSNELLKSALLLGVRGLVAKSCMDSELSSAIQAIIDGEIWLSRGKLSQALINLIESHPSNSITQPAERSAARLSDRECEIARLIAQGLTNKEIGKALGTSDNTVKAHVSHVLARLGLSHRSQIANHPQLFLSAMGYGTAPRPPRHL